MHLEKLVKYLKAFDNRQIHRLKKYIQSPYFQVYPPAQTLFNYLESLHPYFPLKKITVEAIAAQSESLNSLSRQETAASRLQRVIEKFIAQEHWQNSKPEVKRHHLAGLQTLQLFDEFDKKFQKEIDLLSWQTGDDLDTFLQKHQLTELSISGFKARTNRTLYNDLQPLLQSLDEYYAIKKLRILCEAMNRKQVLGVFYKEQQIPILLQILEPYTTPEYPYVYLFVNVYRMLDSSTYEENNLYYSLIKQYAFEQTEVSSALREAMGYAVNNSLNWYNKGYDEAGAEYLWWIDWRMQHGLLFDKGKLTPVTFRNMITMAVTGKMPTDVIEQMIYTYATHLPEEQAETYLVFARAMLAYSQRQYKKAIRLFLAAQAKEDFVFNSIIRRWNWISHYELDPTDSDTLLNQLQSFEKYLQRNRKQPAYVLQAMHLFVKYGEKLVKAGFSDSIEIALTQLQAEDYFAGKNWFLQRLEEKDKTRYRRVRVL